MNIFLKFNFKIIFKNSFFKFLLGGVFNTITSGLILIVLLEFTNIGLATLFSRIYYSLSAYLINSRNIFNKKGNKTKYILFVTFSWLLEWVLLKNLLEINFGKISSIILITPFFAIGSYLIQKYFVFKKIDSF